nr:hypothetical protein [Tanacetum cinerariifolium]
MSKKFVLNDMGKGIGQREVRPIWKNIQRINYQNKFVLTTVLTRISKETTNNVRINGVNTAGQTSVSTVKGKNKTVVKTSAGLDDSVYRNTTNKASASISKGEPSVIKTSNISVEMPKVDSVKNSGVIIKDRVSDDEDTLVDTQVDSKTTVKPSFKKIEFTKARNESVKSDKQADKHKMVTQNSKVDRKDWNGNLTQKPKLGLGFTKKTCFVCGSQKHLIKDYDFHEKRMSKKFVLNDMGKGIGQREVRPI